jgi:hypothetical protein
MPDAPHSVIRYIGIVNQWFGSEMEVKMFSANTVQIKWQLLRTFADWQTNPAPLTFTESEYLGDPAEEYAKKEEGRSLSDAQIPEIEADEFEGAYQWFLV